jgi:hypothetical protein
MEGLQTVKEIEADCPVPLLVDHRVFEWDPSISKRLRSKSDAHSESRTIAKGRLQTSWHFFSPRPDPDHQQKIGSKIEIVDKSVQILFDSS